MNRRQWREADLSAYLDGRLGPEKEAALKASLAQDAELRLKVEQLQQVKSLMHAMPLREPPRNYILTPAMVADPERARPDRTSRWPSLPFMRLVTAATTIAFVLTMGLNFLASGWGSGQMLTMSDTAPAPEVMMLEEAPTEGIMRQQVPQEEYQGADVTEEHTVTVAEVQVEAEAPEAPAAEPTPLPMGTMAIEELPYGAPQPDMPEGIGGVGGGDAGPPPGEKMEEVERQVAPPLEPLPKHITESQSAEDAETETQTVVMPVEVAEGEDVVADNGGPDVSVEETPTSGIPEGEVNPPSGWRGRFALARWLPWVSGVLGVIAVALGGITWWLSRREP